MSYQLELAPGAIEDLAAAAWPRLAHRPRIRARVVRRLRYRIIYEILDRTIVVHAIAHTSRDPGYWLDRIQ